MTLSIVFFRFLTQDSFIQWTNSVSSLTEGEVISIDGKTICGSRDKKKNTWLAHGQVSLTKVSQLGMPVKWERIFGVFGLSISWKSGIIRVLVMMTFFKLC